MWACKERHAGEHLSEFASWTNRRVRQNENVTAPGYGESKWSSVCLCDPAITQRHFQPEESCDKAPAAPVTQSAGEVVIEKKKTKQN